MKKIKERIMFVLLRLIKYDAGFCKKKLFASNFERGFT